MPFMRWRKRNNPLLIFGPSSDIKNTSRIKREAKEIVMSQVNSSKRFKVDKLIRDKLPDIMRGKGIVVHERMMEQEEFIARLKEKLIEEAKEANDTQTKNELAEELSDILEVVYTLAQASGLSLEEIEKIRQNKREFKGGFDSRIYNPFIDIPEGNPAIDYYLSKAHQYPQVNHQQASCIFCQIAHREREAEIYAEFKHCFVIKDQFPVSKGHLLFIPYEHTSNWFTASEEIQTDIMHALTQMKAKLDAEYKPDGYNIGANCGAFAGQTVMHLHLHLIPRYEGDMEDPRGGVRGVIPSKQKY